jgi:hypothetical protein
MISDFAINANKLHHHTYNAWYDKPFIDIMAQLTMNLAADHELTVLCGDISNFDQSIPSEMIHRQGAKEEAWVKAGKAPTTMAKAMTDGLALSTPDGIIENESGSMPSGSVHTNEFDSMTVDEVLITGHEMGLYKLYCKAVQGDDFYALGEGLTPDVVSDLFKLFNFEVHPDKQFYEPNMISYLQMTHIYGMPGGIASAARVINSATSYERMKVRSGKWNDFVEIVRVLSQLENLAFSPYFEDVVHYMAKLDKHGLGRDMNPQEVIDNAGSTGVDAMSEDVIGAWQSRVDAGSFDNWVTNGVLRGEKLPPLGSRQRFERVYMKRVEPFLDWMDIPRWKDAS